MPYRTSSRSQSAALFAQLCAGCGAEHRSGADASDFVCAGCLLEQPALRSGAPPKPKNVLVIGFEKSNEKALMPFAETVGVGEPCTQMRLSVDGANIDVTLSFDSGVLNGVDLTTPMTGFPWVEFSIENTSHVQAKAQGITREVETGDASFDDVVYIDSDAPDDDVLAVVAAPAVRLAIVELLGHTEHIRMSPVGIRAHFSAEVAREQERLHQLIAAFRVLVGARRPLVVSQTAASRAQRATFMSL